MKMQEINSHQPATSAERITETPKVIMYGGNSMEQVSHVPFRRKMMEMFSGADSQDVVTHTSIMSSEIFKTNRFAEMIGPLEEAIEGNRETTIIIYSLGASEFLSSLLRYLDKRQKRNKDQGEFTPLDLSNITLVLRSPAGLVNKTVDNIRQTRQMIDLFSTLARSSFSHLENLLTFPPVMLEDEESATIFEALKIVYPNLAANPQIGELVEPDAIIAAINTKEQNFMEKQWSDEVYTYIQAVDVDLLDLAQQIIAAEQDDIFPVSEILKQEFINKLEDRQKTIKDLLDLDLDAVFKNKQGILAGETWKKEDIEISKIFGIPNFLIGIGNLFAILRRAMIPGNMEIYRWLQSKGVEINLIIPESEVFAPFDTMAAFFAIGGNDTQPGKIKPDSVQVTAGTHISLTNRIDEFAQALQRIIKKN